MIMHYPYAFVFVFSIALNKILLKKTYEKRINSYTKKKLFSNLFLSETHGERGNTLTELYYFNPIFWRKLFKKNGWHIVKVEPIGLFYWGRDFIKEALSIHTRQILAKYLGASSYLYILKKSILESKSTNQK